MDPVPLNRSNMRGGFFSRKGPGGQNPIRGSPWGLERDCTVLAQGSSGACSTGDAGDSSGLVWVAGLTGIVPAATGNGVSSGVQKTFGLRFNP